MPDSDHARHLLLVEDEPALRDAVAEQLRDRGYRVDPVDSGEAAVARLSDFAYDAIITDLRLPGIDGSAVVDAAIERYPDIVAIVVTGFGTVKQAVEAIKRGAADFVSKPFQIDELTHALSAALEQRRLKSENAYLRAQLDQRYAFEGIVHVLRTQRNMRIHFIVAIVVLVAALAADVSRLELIVLFVSIAFVLVAEMVDRKSTRLNSSH